MDDIRTIWVRPFYQDILSEKYTTEQTDQDFIANARSALMNITPAIIDRLFTAREWRSRITAAWFCGIRRWSQYADIIGASLIDSEVCYAGQGYSFALARFADSRSAQYLVRYLEAYLPQTDKYYDQAWAMPALMWIDDCLGAKLSDRFLVKDGLWDHFVADKIGESEEWSIEHCKSHFHKVMECAQATFD